MCVCGSGKPYVMGTKCPYKDSNTRNCQKCQKSIRNSDEYTLSSTPMLLQVTHFI